MERSPLPRPVKSRVARWAWAVARWFPVITAKRHFALVEKWVRACEELDHLNRELWGDRLALDALLRNRLPNAAPRVRPELEVGLSPNQLMEVRLWAEVEPIWAVCTLDVHAMLHRRLPEPALVAALEEAAARAAAWAADDIGRALRDDLRAYCELKIPELVHKSNKFRR